MSRISRLVAIGSAVAAAAARVPAGPAVAGPAVPCFEGYVCVVLVKGTIIAPEADGGCPKAEKNLGVFALPGTSAGESAPIFLGGSNIAVAAKSKNKELAYNLLKVLLGVLVLNALWLGRGVIDPGFRNLDVTGIVYNARLLLVGKLP